MATYKTVLEIFDRLVLKTCTLNKDKASVISLLHTFSEQHVTDRSPHYFIE